MADWWDGENDGETQKSKPFGRGRGRGWIGSARDMDTDSPRDWQSRSTDRNAGRTGGFSRSTRGRGNFRQRDEQMNGTSHRTFNHNESRWDNHNIQNTTSGQTQFSGSDAIEQTENWDDDYDSNTARTTLMSSNPTTVTSPSASPWSQENKSNFAPRNEDSSFGERQHSGFESRPRGRGRGFGNSSRGGGNDSNWRDRGGSGGRFQADSDSNVLTIDIDTNNVRRVIGNTFFIQLFHIKYSQLWKINSGDILDSLPSLRPHVLHSWGHRPINSV